MTILDTIVATKRTEVAAARLERPLAELEAIAKGCAPVRGLAAALRRPSGARCACSPRSSERRRPQA